MNIKNESFNSLSWYLLYQIKGSFNLFSLSLLMVFKEDKSISNKYKLKKLYFYYQGSILNQNLNESETGLWNLKINNFIDYI